MPFNKTGDGHEKLKTRYADTVFLKSIEGKSREKDILSIVIRDNGVNTESTKSLLSRSIKKGYIEKGRNISVVSTVNGRQTISEERMEISEKGKKMLEEREDWLKFFDFASPYITIVEYQEGKRRAGRNWKFENVMIAALSKKIDRFKEEKKYRDLKNLYLDIGELYAMASYKSRAMYCFIAALYFDTSGIEYYEDFLKYTGRRISYDELKKKYRGIYIESRIIDDISGAKEGYMSDMVEHVYRKNRIGINFYTKSRLKQLIADMIEGKFSYSEWVDYSYKAFEKMVDVAGRYRQRRT